MGPAMELSELVRRCPSILHLKSVHAFMLRSNSENPVLLSELISGYSHKGSLPLAHSTFLSSPPHPSLLTSLIRAYTDLGSPDCALSLYHRFRPRHPPAFPVLIKACSALRDLPSGELIHAHAQDLGISSHPSLVNALIAFYGKCDRIDIARKLFDEMPQKTVVSWSALISAYAFNGLRKQALSVFSTMHAEGVEPNRGAFTSLMGCVSNVESAERLWQLIQRNEMDDDELLRNTAIGMFTRCGGIDKAREVFDEMPVPKRRATAWNSIIKAYAEAGSPMEALEVFRNMLAVEAIPDRETISAVIFACCEAASMTIARSLHGYTIRNFEEDCCQELIDLYVKCGGLEVARKLFDSAPEKSVALWNAMISGYGIHGQGKDALVLFDRMKDSVQPDHNTFSSVLLSCCLANLVEEGRRCFDSMKDHDVVPEPRHYAYMVDLLGRDGQLDGARDYIKNMPVEPDASLWGALLCASRNYFNVELAESSARSLLESDPENMGCQVLLSNIYRCSGREKEAEEIEASMRERATKKIVGASFVEANHVVYRFLNGDRSNMESDEIYKELEKLLDSVKEHGYKPEDKLVMHDVEGETVVESQHAHSEKLAVAFGFLNSGPDDDILVHKNSSVCRDCHMFVKLASKVTGRVIVLRDAHRFHYFQDGTCSCGDYW